MRKITSVISIFIALLFLSSFAKAQTEKLDNLAACARIVIGNGAVDFYLGDEQSFDVSANVAYAAYFSEVFLEDISKMICRWPTKYLEEA